MELPVAAPAPWPRLGRLLAGAAGLLLLILLAGLAMVWSQLPSPTTLDQRVAAVSHQAGQVPLTGPEVPAVLGHALVASEDERFYSHHGLDSIGIGRSIYDDLRWRCLCEGGSTITQQLVKLAYYPEARVVERKLPGMLMALRIETRYSKAHILAAYFSVAYTGQGLLGARAAARTYFGRELGTIDVAQAAEIAGLVQSPAGSDPRVHPGRARVQRDQVLARMLEAGYVSRSAYDLARLEPLLGTGS